jgi:hypothetical protein
VIFLWARQRELENGLETRLYDAVREWVADEWPFEHAAYPGRSIEWERWSRIPDETSRSCRPGTLAPDEAAPALLRYAVVDLRRESPDRAMHPPRIPVKYDQPPAAGR